MGHTFRMADLFAGAGGMSLGFTMLNGPRDTRRERDGATFSSVFAVEIDSSAANTYRANFGAHVHTDDVAFVDRLPPVHVVIGGPPCQGFSPLGRQHRWDWWDPRNALWTHFLRLVESARPLMFVMENVPEMLRSAEFEAIQQRSAELGYDIAFGILSAVDFGVPQARRRAFIIGSRIGTPVFPAPTGERANVRDAIADLPLVPTEEGLHFGRNPTEKSLERYRHVPPGGNRFDLPRELQPACWLNKPTGSTDVFGRLEWDKPSLTIRTEFFKPEKGRYLHPVADRPITHREAARLQTFPDDFAFTGSRISIAKQIGNAVPPKLAMEVARVIAQHLEAAVLRDPSLLGDQSGEVAVYGS